MWTFLADSLLGFVFSPSRSGETPKRVLGGSKGTLQVDAYTGYNAVTKPEGRTRVGCLAHMRRKRVVSLGRKNYLFVGDDDGGEHLATLLTVVATCVASGVNPEAYVADVLLRVATTPNTAIDTLLPAAWKTAQDRAARPSADTAPT